MSVVLPATATVGQPVTITPQVADSSVGVWGVKVAGADGIPICTFHAPPYTCTWTPMVPGTQTIRVIGMNAAGHSAVATGNVTVNPPAQMAPPTVSLVAAAVTGVSTPTGLTATASANAGIAELQFIVDGKTQCTVKAAPYACNWTPGASGYTSIEARAVDAAGNVASVSTSMQVNAYAVPYRALALRGDDSSAPGELNAPATATATRVVAKIRTATAQRSRSGI